MQMSILWEILWGKKKKPQKGWSFQYNIGRPIFKQPTDGGKIMLELNCSNEEKIPITVTPLSPAGKPASIQGAVVVTVQDGAGTINMIGDLSFEVVSGDVPGDTTYLVSADADLGDGVIEIQDIIILHVAGAMAANLGLSAGAAIPK